MKSGRVRSRELLYDVGFGIDGDAASRVAVEIYWPASGLRPVVWFALPGGAMNRHFYDLTDGNNTEYSFARQMAARGFPVVLVDTPGIGGSDRPRDGFALTPERLVAILHTLHGRIMDDLRAGNIDPELPPRTDLKTIGVGHSMGAVLTLCQQAAVQSHAAIALLGFGMAGLPAYLPPDVRDLASDVAGVRARLVSLAREMFKDSYPRVQSGGDGDFYGSSGADRAAVRALKQARDVLLPVPAYLSMLPGNVKPEAARIAVPVYQAFGDADFINHAAEDASVFAASPGVKRQVLPRTGHSFFLFETREALFDSMAEWAGGLT